MRSHVASDMLLHSLGFALPPTLIWRERAKVLSVARRLLAPSLGAEAGLEIIGKVVY